MIRKIKKFKIAVRPSYVLRGVRKKTTADLDPEALEQSIDQEISGTQNLIEPSALYNTFSRKNAPETLAALWQNQPPQALSVSLILVSVGGEIELEIVRRRSRGEELRAVILEAIARDALEAALGFVVRLLEEEAKAEACELVPPLPAEPAQLGDILTLLESAKAGVTLTPAGQIAPLFSSLNVCFWHALSKHRNVKSA